MLREEFTGDAAAFFQACADHQLEGIVSKLALSKYRSGRSKKHTVELGYVVDVLANMCWPNLAVLYEVACALDETHRTENEQERPHPNKAHRH